MGKRWTDKEDGILETLRDGGMTFEEVASIMGRTKQAVQQRAYMLKRNEPTFREVVDTAFAKHGIEFGEHGDWYEGMSTKQVYNALEQENTNGIKENMRDLSKMINQMERDIKPKPQWWKAMMWWRK